jgi:hypothetical protein
MKVHRVRLDRRWSRALAGLVLGSAALIGLLALVSASADIGSPASGPATNGLEIVSEALPPAYSLLLSQPPVRPSLADSLLQAAPPEPGRRPTGDAPWRPPEPALAPSRSGSATLGEPVMRHPGSDEGAVRWERQDPFIPGSLRHGSPLLLQRAAGPTGIAPARVITFDITYGAATGYTTPNSDVHLLLRDGATVAGEARTRSDGLGYFYAELMHDGRYAKAQPGQVLDVVAGGSTTSLTVPAITGIVDPGTDSITGKITGVPLPATLRVSC